MRYPEALSTRDALCRDMRIALECIAKGDVDLAVFLLTESLKIVDDIKDAEDQMAGN